MTVDSAPRQCKSGVNINFFNQQDKPICTDILPHLLPPNHECE